MVIPGTLWTSIAILLGMLPALLTQNFENAPWLLLVVGVVGIVAKIWDVYKPSDAVQPDADNVAFEMAPNGLVAPAPSRSATSRVLLG
jgi:hypothetical protein